MPNNKTYKQLCRVNLFHQYHLNDGNTSFDSDPALRERQLKSYSFRSFARIVPALNSQIAMNNQKLFFSETPSGFDLFVAAKPVSPGSSNFTTARGINKDLVLYFLIYITDPLFENYSTVSAIQQQPFYFSNKRPKSQGGSYNYIDVEAVKPFEDFTINSTAFGHIANQLNPAELRGCFGIIGLRMKGDNTVPIDGHARDRLKGNGRLVDTPPVFKIQFENRETIWHYKDASDGSLIHSSDPTTLPLVKQGIVGYSFSGQDRPAAQPTRLVFETDSNGNILKTFSEIYI